jgi:hypothetical protein
MSANLLKQTLADGKYYIKASTYTNSNFTISNGSSGSQQLLLQIRNTSVKSLIHQFGISQSAVCPNGLFDAINPSLTTRQLSTGDKWYPNKPINDSQRPAEAFFYLQQSLGGSTPKNLGTVVDRYMYNAVIPTIPTASDSTLVVPAAGLRAVPAGGPDIETGKNIISKWPNSAYMGYDLEKSAGILFQGINTRASPPYLNLFLANAMTSTIVCTAWGLSDVVLVIDPIAKQVQAFI